PRSAPLPIQTPASGQARSRLGRGWRWGSQLLDTSCATTTTPTPALCHSRCFASAFLAPRTAPEGRLCPPHKGEGRTEFDARAETAHTNARRIAVLAPLITDYRHGRRTHPPADADEFPQLSRRPDRGRRGAGDPGR